MSSRSITPSRRRRSAAAAVSLLTVLAPIAVAATTAQASAATASKSCSSASQGRTEQQTDDFINGFVAQLSQNGSSQDQIDQQLADSLCLVRIDNGSDSAAVTPMASTASGTSLTPPSIYWDNQALRYYAISKWSWNDSWKNDANFTTNVSKNMGGPDGFATSFNKSLLLTGYSLTVYGDAPYASSANISPASTANSYGAGYAFQDTGKCQLVGLYCSWRLNVRSGQEVISFKKSGTCKTVYGFASYTHTWSSTSLNSIGIGPYSISFGWSSTDNHWTGASQPGGTATVC